MKKIDNKFNNLLKSDNNIIIGFTDVLNGYYVKLKNPLIRTKGYNYNIFDKVADDGIYIVTLLD